MKTIFSIVKRKDENKLSRQKKDKNFKQMKINYFLLQINEREKIATKKAESTFPERKKGIII